MVDRSASADWRAAKMLFDMMKSVKEEDGIALSAPDAPPLPEAHQFKEADEKAIKHLVERIREQVLQEIAEGKTPDPRK